MFSKLTLKKLFSMIKHLTNFEDMLDYVSAQFNTNPLDFRLRIVGESEIDQPSTDFGFVPVDTLIKRMEKDIIYGIYDREGDSYPT